MFTLTEVQSKPHGTYHWRSGNSEVHCTHYVGNSIYVNGAMSPTIAARNDVEIQFNTPWWRNLTNTDTFSNTVDTEQLTNAAQNLWYQQDHVMKFEVLS